MQRQDEYRAHAFGFIERAPRRDSRRTEDVRDEERTVHEYPFVAALGDGVVGVIVRQAFARDDAPVVRPVVKAPHRVCVGGEDRVHLGEHVLHRLARRHARAQQPRNARERVEPLARGGRFQLWRGGHPRRCYSIRNGFLSTVSLRVSGS
jgi:hypothetical protein